MTKWFAYPLDEHGNVVWDVEPLSFSMNPGDAPQGLIADFFCAINDLQKAAGGYGIRFIAEEDAP
jgi:hypothetical protein